MSCIVLTIPSQLFWDVSFQLYFAVSVLFTLMMIRVAFSVSLMLKNGKEELKRGLPDGEFLLPLVVGAVLV